MKSPLMRMKPNRSLPTKRRLTERAADRAGALGMARVMYHAHGLDTHGCYVKHVKHVK